MNQYEGKFKRVLCVCTANMLRSPTAALVLSQAPFHFNTRSAGVGDCALIKVTPQLLLWAEEVVTMEPEHTEAIKEILKEIFGRSTVTAPVIIELGIPDDYGYRDPELMKLIEVRYRMYAGVEAICEGSSNS